MKAVSESMVFPNTGMQVLACLIHYLGLAIITHCLSRRIATEDLTSWQGLSQLTWPRALVLLVFFDSWLFVFTSGMIIFGVGMELSPRVCSAGIYLCIVFYSTSKILIYAFLIEKVHIVWSPTAGYPRFKSRIYLVCFVTVALYTIIIAMLLVGRINYFRDGDMACVIGLKPMSSIPLLSYDLYVNVFLTALFLWPLFRAQVVSPPVKKVAVRTLLASAVALTTSTVNMSVLTVLKGTELGWVCLGSCAADVVINALAIFWVTGGLDLGSRTGGSNAFSRGLPERRRTDTRAAPDGERDPVKAKLGEQQTSTYGFYPQTSFVEPPRPERQGDLESGHRRMPSSKPKFKGIAGLFRTKSRSVEEHDLQITVTTEFELDDPHTEAESVQGDETKRQLGNK